MQTYPYVDGVFDLECIRDAVDQVWLEPSDENVCADEPVSFRKINLRRTSDRTAILKIYHLIAKGEFRALQFTEDDSLGDALFSEVELSRLLQEEGGARECTAGDVARFSGWGPECVTGWCEQGLLRATRGKQSALEVWQISEIGSRIFGVSSKWFRTWPKKGKTISRKLLASFADRGSTSVGSRPAGSSSRGHLTSNGDLPKIMISMPT